MNINFLGSLCLALALSTVLSAQAPGTLDSQFGAGGVTLFPFSTYPSECRAMAVQTDGRVVLGGHYQSGGKGNLAFVRLTVNGTPDNTFGSGGSAIVAQNNSSVNLQALQILSNGKIVGGGNSDGMPTLVRLNANGTIDNTFGAGGQVSFDGGITALSDMKVLPDGKIVGAGIADLGNGKLFCAFRRNADGSADNSFGTAGFAYANIGSQPSLLRMAVQSDGKILLTGTVFFNLTKYDLALFRFTANGGPDNTFGTNGLVTTVLSTNSAYEQGNALTVQPDGKIVVAGRIANAGPTIFAIVRYNANGSLDTSFGTNGFTKFNYYTTLDEPKAVVLQGDLIVVAGTAINGAARELTLARLTKNGALDPTFGTGGKTTTAVGTRALGEAVALQNGKIIAAGSATVSNLSQFLATRYHTGGVLATAEQQAGVGSAVLFPNPARAGDGLTFRFTLEEQGNCRLSWMSLDGRLLQTLPGQLLSAGEHALTLTVPAGLPAGRVLFRLETETGAVALPVQVVE